MTIEQLEQEAQKTIDEWNEIGKKYKMKKPFDKRFYVNFMFLTLPHGMTGYYKNERNKFIDDLFAEYGLRLPKPFYSMGDE